MTNLLRTSAIALAALAAGGFAGYGYSASLPVSVTSTDVSLSAPSGEAALTHARAGITHLDSASAAFEAGDLDQAVLELTSAKASFAGVAAADAHDDQPVAVAQEAIIIHKFSPSPEFVTTGSAGANEADLGGLTLTKGRSTKPLALSDYTIKFGDLSVDTDLVSNHIDQAIQDAKAGKKNEAAQQIEKARGAITFIYSGDQIGEN